MRVELEELDADSRFEVLSGLASGVVSWGIFCDYTADNWKKFTDQERSDLLFLTVIFQLQGRVSLERPSPKVLAQRLESLPRIHKRSAAIRILCVESIGSAPVCLQSPAPNVPEPIYQVICRCYSEREGDQAFALAMISHATTRDGQADWGNTPYNALLTDPAIESALEMDDLTAAQYFSLPTIQTLFLCASQDRNRLFRKALISKLKSISTEHPGSAILTALGWNAADSTNARTTTRIINEFDPSTKYTFARCRPKTWQPTADLGRDSEFFKLLTLQKRLDERVTGVRVQPQAFTVNEIPSQSVATQLQPLWQNGASVGEWIGAATTDAFEGVYVSSMYLVMGCPIPGDTKSADFLLRMFEDAISSHNWVGFAAATTLASKMPEHHSKIINMIREHVGSTDGTPFMFGSECIAHLNRMRR